MFYNSANLLTLLRIVLAFLFLFCFYSANIYIYYLAVFFFITAAITDLLDGHIARKKKQVSDFGRLIDPLADKILLCCGLFPLVEMRLFPVWIAVIILTREFAINGLRSFAASKGKVIAANIQGKYKTTFQLSALISILVIHGYFRTLENFYGSVALIKNTYFSSQYSLFWWLNLEADFLIWTTLIVTVLSGMDYFRRNLYLFKQSV